MADDGDSQDARQRLSEMRLPSSISHSSRTQTGSPMMSRDLDPALQSDGEQMGHRSSPPDLTETHPRIAADWDHERNETAPEDVTHGVRHRVWWRCSVQDCGHRWQATVRNRTRGNGCPKCSRRPAPGRSLADRYPDIAAEWDRERNEMAPEDVTYGSARKVWWRCSVQHCGNRWQAQVKNRTRGSGCPRCHWRPASGQSLADRHPELIVEWDDERNSMTPQDVGPASGRKVWWRCSAQECGHRWLAAVTRRTRGNGCPECHRNPVSRQSLADSRDAAQPRDGENAKHRGRKPDITETHPRIAAEWDHERNEIEPDDVTYGSGREVWWRCSVQGCGHRWLATVSRRTHGNGCPECHRRPASGQSLADRHPQLIVEWDDERNPMTPHDVMHGSKTMIWWRCSVQGCGHRWQARAHNRGVGSGCPKCCLRPGPGQSLVDKHPELIVEWDDERNLIAPKDITPGSDRKVWWRCSVQDCGHRWQAIVGSRTRGVGCPKCGRKRKPARGRSLADRFPELIVEWDDERNPMTPRDVAAMGNKKVWWRCSVQGCGHRWQSVVGNRTRGRGCPACAGKTVKATNSLAATHPDVAAQWDYDRNQSLTPDAVSAGSRRKVWWRCLEPDCGHSWSVRVKNRTGGSGCPKCARRRRRSTGQDTNEARQQDDHRGVPPEEGR